MAGYTCTRMLDTMCNKLTRVSRSFPNHDNLTSIPINSNHTCTILLLSLVLLYSLLGHKSGFNAVRINDTHLFDNVSPEEGGEPGTVVLCASLTCLSLMIIEK